MKFNIEIDLNYIDEDGLDDEFKNQLIQSITADVISRFTNTVEIDMRNAMRNAMQQAQVIMEAKALEFADKCLEQESYVQTRHGEAFQTMTLPELAEASFKGLLSTRVNDDGTFAEFKGDNQTLLEYLVDRRVMEYAETNFNITPKAK